MTKSEELNKITHGLIVDILYDELGSLKSSRTNLTREIELICNRINEIIYALELLNPKSEEFTRENLSK